MGVHADAGNASGRSDATVNGKHGETFAGLTPPGPPARDVETMFDEEAAPSAGRLPAENPLLLRRMGALFLTVVLLALVISTRLVVMTVWQGAYWLERAEGNFLKPKAISPPRGVIVDRHGDPLAVNLPVFDLRIRRYRQPRHEIVEAMAELRNLSGRPLLSTTQRVLDTWPAWRPIDLLRGLKPTEAIPLLERVGAWSSMEAELRYMRHYPAGRTTAHLLGYLRRIPPEQWERRQGRGYLPNDLVGWTGLESGAEELLRGRLGREVLMSDALSRELDRSVSDTAKPGARLELTLDLGMQQTAYELLAKGGRPGSVVAIDPRNGAILTLASFPAFDPETRSLLPGDTEWHGALRTATAPASTMKMFTAIAMLEAGLPGEGRYFCGGSFKFDYYNRRFHCDHREGCGSLDLRQALQRSCNVFFFRGANSLGGARMREIYERFGFGRPTGFATDEGLGPESAGSLLAGARTYPADVIMASIGQGQVSATTLQLARAVAALANGGTLYRPYLIQGAFGPDGFPIRRAEPTGERIALNPLHRQAVVAGLRAVMQPGGTASRAGFDPAWQVAGKTGTAERADKTDAWFACFSPAEAPRVVIVVRVEEAGHGSQGAAPIARDVMQRFYEERPRAARQPSVASLTSAP